MTSGSSVYEDHRVVALIVSIFRTKSIIACKWYYFQMRFHSTKINNNNNKLIFVHKKSTYRTIILPVVLYVCETWSLTLREERRPRVFEKRVLKRIFGHKRDEVIGE
jgi:hypothetical protein